MEFNKPSGSNIFDRAKIIGRPHKRIDGPLKVTGTAPYAYERNEDVPSPLVGYPVGATIAKGRILSMDPDAAREAPGVAAVVTTLDVEPLPLGDMNVARLFGGDEIEHYHQAIAVVVADTLEQARAAASLIGVEYDEEQPDVDLEAAFRRVAGTGDTSVDVGDFETTFAEAEVRLDEVYRTPSQSHAMMEPHATTADWSDGERLTLWTSNQMIAWGRQSLAKMLSLPEDKIRIESPYIGGGFGGKLFLRSDAVLAAIGSRAARRPVKLELPRPFIMNNTTHRSETIQHIRLTARPDGRLTGIGHEAASHTLPGGDGENSTGQSSCFYAGAHRKIIHHAIEMDLPEASAMRAPGEASGLMALEIAMDEMAEKLGMDPVEFRILNDTQIDPSDPDVAFSDRNFVACLKRGAEEFGWRNRNSSPGGQREGGFLIGHGMAGAYRGGPTMDSGARARLEAGRLTIETDMTDIGTGSYTILAQTAAETMGLPMDAVEVRLGNSAFPVAAGSGGQFGAASATAGVYAACLALQREIARKLKLTNPVFENGEVRAGNTVLPLSEVAGGREFVAEDKVTFGDFKDKLKIATFAAHFVEVGVNAATGEVRVRRMLAVCDAGRIFNPVTARSQVIGGMTMGIGAALSEEMSKDHTGGFFANHDLAGYEVPVHADVPEQEVIFLDTIDAAVAPLKGKGVGELGLCGVAAAIANAVYNATGVRVRDYPITPDKLIDHLPAMPSKGR